MFPVYEVLDCTKTACMNRGYEYVQNRQASLILDPISTYRRCYKEPDVEHMLRTEQYMTRFCDLRTMCPRKGGVTEAMPPKGSIAGPVAFHQDTKQKDGYNGLIRR